jgi:hypothetical protein
LSRHFSFYNTQDNLQKWRVTLLLKKEDSFNNRRPGGTYTGFVQINVDQIRGGMQAKA